MTFEIMWGHSGRFGHEWQTAREAARYASIPWGTVEADTPEGAVVVFAQDAGEPFDWHADGSTVHVVFRPQVQLVNGHPVPYSCTVQLDGVSVEDAGPYVAEVQRYLDDAAPGYRIDRTEGAYVFYSHRED